MIERVPAPTEPPRRQHPRSGLVARAWGTRHPVKSHTGRKHMAEPKGHKTGSAVEPEAHESRSRAAAGEADGSYVGAAGSDDSFDAGETGAEARSQQG